MKPLSHSGVAQHVRTWLLKRGIDIRRISADTEAKAISRLLRDEHVTHFLDVGANQGQFGLFVRSLGFTGPLHSYEPDPTNFAKLSKAAEGDASWHCHNFAVGGAEPSEQILNVASNSGLSSSLLQASSLMASEFQTITFDRGVNVQVMPLPDVFGRLNSASGSVFLKVDVQGYERFVFEGGFSEEVASRVPALLVESSFRPMYDGAWDISEELRFFYDLGYTLAAIFPEVFSASGDCLEADLLLRKS